MHACEIVMISKGSAKVRPVTRAEPLTPDNAPTCDTVNKL